MTALKLFFATLSTRSGAMVSSFALAMGLGLPAGCSHTHKESGDPLLKVPTTDLSRLSSGDGVKLSVAIQENLKSEPMSDSRKQLLAFLEAKFIGKKLDRSNHSSTASFIECKQKFKNAPECTFLRPSWSEFWLEIPLEDEGDAEVTLKIQDRESLPPLTRLSRSQKQKALQQLVGRIKKSEWGPVPNQRDGDYYRALKRFQSWTPELAELSKRLVERTECESPELYSYLGLKAEEYFPNDELWGVAISLYSKADDCAKSKPELNSVRYVQSARFRLGLLSIMKNDCQSATSVFTRLAKMGVSDYSTRAHYWNAYCARSDANIDQFQYSFEELFKSNPLGFHTLTINNGSSHLVDNLSQSVDPLIQTRTSRESSYNVWISLMEDFDRMGNSRVVWKLLAPVRKTPEYLKVLEPRVRLYLSTFAFRSHDPISLFRILDSVFRTQSEYVLESTLKLFYPMKHFDQILSQVRTVHPFLITALIRQESAFQENARSRVGASGLMQLMPRTARLMDRSISRIKLFDPKVNIRVGVAYFEKLVQRYQGDVELALAAYNAGPEVVDKWAKRYPVKNRLLFLDLIPYAETRNYVTLIGRNYYWYSRIYSELLKKDGIAQMEPNEFRALKSTEEPLAH